MRNTPFPNYSSTNSPRTTSPIFAPTVDVHPFERRSPRTRKLSAAQVSDNRAQIDSSYKARMQLARAELAKDLYEDEPQSIAQLRLKKGLSQAQLARDIGTSQPHIAKIEAKLVKLQLNTASRLAKALDIDMNTLTRIVETESGNSQIQAMKL